MRPFPPEVDAVATTQFGLITHRQLADITSRSTVLRLARAGAVLPVLPRVYRLAGAPPTWRQRALAACLSVGGEVAASHLSAGCLWQVPSVARPLLELTVPRHRAARIIDDVVIHRRTLPPDDVTDRWGIPTTTPARTLIDL